MDGKRDARPIVDPLTWDYADKADGPAKPRPHVVFNVSAGGEPVVARSHGVVPAHAIVAAGLPDRQTTLSRLAIEAYREAWRGLKRENAPFRVIDEAGLVSAPITYFDDLVASFATDDWRPGVRLVGDAMAANWEAPHGRHVSDLVLIARVHALAAGGVFDIKGDVSTIRGLFVRRNRGLAPSTE